MVPLVVCRGCGRPAWVQTPILAYCGADACLNLLVEFIDPKKVKVIDQVEAKSKRFEKLKEKIRDRVNYGPAFHRLGEEEDAEYWAGFGC